MIPTVTQTRDGLWSHCHCTSILAADLVALLLISYPSLLPSLSKPLLSPRTTYSRYLMGALCCRPQPIDFDGEVSLFHFVLLRCVGKGAFGKVRIQVLSCDFLPMLYRQVRVVQHKQGRELYALKYINKAKCVKMKAVANIIQERRLLEEVLISSSFR